jgi:hypothetical protein
MGGKELGSYPFWPLVVVVCYVLALSSPADGPV